MVSFAGENTFLIQTETKSSDGASAAVDWCKVVISSSTYITSPQQYRDWSTVSNVFAWQWEYKDEYLFSRESDSRIAV